MKKKFITSILSLALAMVWVSNGAVVNAQTIFPLEPSGFDAQYYAQTNPDVVAAFGEDEDRLLLHYVTAGKFEGRKPYEDATERTNTKTADYNVLFIGNSISLHPKCQYWWGEWGMSATKPENDYVHKVISGLSEEHETVDYDVACFKFWEHENMGKKMLPNLDPFLCNDYDLIVIQLGENSHEIEKFKSEYELLINYVSKSVPDAEIILVGDFWCEGNRDEVKEEIASRLQLDYVDLKKMRCKAKYVSKMGEKVYGDDGQIHEIDFPPVSVHPNDAGMEYIAKEILKLVNN